MWLNGCLFLQCQNIYFQVCKLLCLNWLLANSRRRSCEHWNTTSRLCRRIVFTPSTATSTCVIPTQQRLRHSVSTWQSISVPSTSNLQLPRQSLNVCHATTRRFRFKLVRTSVYLWPAITLCWKIHLYVKLLSSIIMFYYLLLLRPFRPLLQERLCTSFATWCRRLNHRAVTFSCTTMVALCYSTARKFLLQLLQEIAQYKYRNHKLHEPNDWNSVKI